LKSNRCLVVEEKNVSDLICRNAVIENIKELLKSPYAYSSFGAITEEEAYFIRKEMAETIIDLCVKRAEIAYDTDKVIEQLKRLQEDGIPTRSAINLVRGGGILKH